MYSALSMVKISSVIVDIYNFPRHLSCLLTSSQETVIVIALMVPSKGFESSKPYLYAAVL